MFNMTNKFQFDVIFLILIWFYIVEGTIEKEGKVEDL